MNEIVITTMVVIGLIVVTWLVNLRQLAEIRPYVWLAFFEYMMCTAAQTIYSRVLTVGGDAVLYNGGGAELAIYLEQQFSWASGELIAMLFQQPNAFDSVAVGGGTNTASMYAVSAWLLYFLGRSEFAVSALVSGLAFFGALGIFNALRDSHPEGSVRRLFVATVLFPSVAFWTSALHKEAFCLVGMGALFAAWRAAYNRRLVALIYGPFGAAVVVLFRAPVMPPLLLGFVLFFAAERIRKVRGADTVILAPVYVVAALGALALGMLVLAKVSPGLALDQLGEAVTQKQAGWTRGAQGGSFVGDAGPPQTLSGQILSLPLGLINALFRPQFFDVNNFGALLGAIEMTVITWMVVQAIRMHGFRGILVRIQRSPFLLMCVVITVVGCTFVGLVTPNLGSLSRYRVPFLPFYGALVSTLSARKTSGAVARAAPGTRAASGSLVRARSRSGRKRLA